MMPADLGWQTPLDGLDLGAGHHWPVLALLALLGTCAVVAVVDWRSRIIPNGCNFVIMGLGLGLAATEDGGSAVSAAWQGAVAFALFWLARALYRAVRSVPGLGLGDVKFLGAAAIWVGLAGLPPLLLVACAAALAYVGLQWWRGTAVTARHAIPFGPFLVLGFVSVVAGALI